MIIKRWDGSGFVEQYPKTLETMIYDSESPTDTPIFESGKIKPKYLPDGVFSGMTFVGTITENNGTNPLELKEVIIGTAGADYLLSSSLGSFTTKTWPDDYDDIGQRYIGHYWIATNTCDIYDATTGTEQADWATAVFDDGVIPTDVSGYDKSLTLEAGDWLIITGWDNTNNTFKFNVINNTYTLASTTSKGVVEFADSTEISAKTSTTRVMSVASLFSNFAEKTHTHSPGNITLTESYANITTEARDSLDLLLTDLNTIVGGQATSISTNATDIDNLEARIQVFSQTDEPSTTQEGAIWFDI